MSNPISFPVRFDALKPAKGTSFLYRHGGAGKIYQGAYQEASPSGKYVKLSQGSAWDIPHEIFVVEILTTPGEEKLPESETLTPPKSPVVIPAPQPEPETAPTPMSARMRRKAQRAALKAAGNPNS